MVRMMTPLAVRQKDRLAGVDTHLTLPIPIILEDVLWDGKYDIRDWRPKGIVRRWLLLDVGLGA